MKTLLLFLFILVNIPLLAQVKRVAVGDDSIVYVFDKGRTSTNSCQYGIDTCMFVVLGIESQKPPFLFEYGTNGITFKPTTSGVFIDTVVVAYNWVYNRPPRCMFSVCNSQTTPTFDTVIVTGEGYYDNSVKLSYDKDTYYGNIYFSVDSTGEKYTSRMRYTSFTVFNNTDEEIICTAPKIAVNDSLLIHMDMYRDEIISTLVVPSHSYNSASLQFSTTATPANTEKKYVGQIAIPFKGSAMDSVLLRPITLIFERKPIFKGVNYKRYQIYIYPNPAPSATISCHIPGLVNQPLQLSIFDVLGNKRLSFFDGMEHSGDYHFKIDLPIGAYYVKFVTPEGIQMLNLISTQ